MIRNDDHGGEPVREVGHLVKGEPLHSLTGVSDGVIKALVHAFLVSD
jgi:hypothetical protein